MVGRWCLWGGCLFFEILRGLGLPTIGQHAWLIFTSLWILLVEGHYASWWGFGSSLRLVFFFPPCSSCIPIHMPYRLGPCTIPANCIHTDILQTITLQTAIFESCKLYHNLLQTIILQTAISKSYILSSCTLPFLNLVHCHLALSYFLALDLGLWSHC